MSLFLPDTSYMKSARKQTIIRKLFSYKKANSDRNKGKPIFWIILCLGFLFLGIDEQFMVHESIDIFTHNLIGLIFNYQGNSITKRIDDIIVLIYFI